MDINQRSTLVVGIEQAGARHVYAERYRLAHDGSGIRLETAGDLEVTKPEHRKRLGSGRLDQLDRSLQRSDARFARLQLRCETVDVLRPDAEYQSFGAPAGSGAARARAASLPSAARTEMLAGPARRAGMKFIAGDPMKPATNMLAGRS